MAGSSDIQLPPGTASVAGHVTRLLAEAGHVQAVPLPKRRSDPRAAAGFRVLPSADGAVYVTWATSGSRPFQATDREQRECLSNVTAYAPVLQAAGYPAEVTGVRWHTIRIPPPVTDQLETTPDA